MCAVKVLCLSCTSEPLCSSLYVLVAARLRCYSPTDGNHVTTTQAVGTLLGTMFGFVSAALLTPIHGGEREDGLPAAPGVVSYSLRLVFTDVSRPTSRSTTSSRILYIFPLLPCASLGGYLLIGGTTVLWCVLCKSQQRHCPFWFILAALVRELFTVWSEKVSHHSRSSPEYPM